MKKAELQQIVGYMVETLGNREKLGLFIADLSEYAAELDEANVLTTEQEEALQNAQNLVEAQRNALVGAGIMAESAFDAIKPDEAGGTLQKALATIQTLTGSDEMRQQAARLAGIDRILANSCEAAIPMTVSADSASFGVKSSKSGGSRQNPDRPSLKVLKNGLKEAKFWRYAKVWYEIVGTPKGIRVFNLNTREELTNSEDLPDSASKAQKCVTSGWADAFRGYIDALPADSSVNALEAAELS